MKNLTDLLKTIDESKNTPVNFYIMNCGAMNEYKQDLIKTIKSIKGEVYVNIFNEDGIQPVDNIIDAKFAGGHLNDLSDVVKETKEHLGELSFIVTC